MYLTLDYSTARVVIDTMLSIEVYYIGMNKTNSRGGHRTIPCWPLYYDHVCSLSSKLIV